MSRDLAPRHRRQALVEHGRRDAAVLGVGQEFYRGASEPATDDNSNRVDIARVQASAKENGGIELLGPPPFEAANAT